MSAPSAWSEAGWGICQAEMPVSCSEDGESAVSRLLRNDCIGEPPVPHRPYFHDASSA